MIFRGEQLKKPPCIRRLGSEFNQKYICSFKMFLFQVTHWCLHRKEDLWNLQQQRFQVKKLIRPIIEKNLYLAIHVKLLSSNSSEVEPKILQFT